MLLVLAWNMVTLALIFHKLSVEIRRIHPAHCSPDSAEMGLFTIDSLQSVSAHMTRMDCTGVNWSLAHRHQVDHRNYSLQSLYVRVCCDVGNERFTLDSSSECGARVVGRRASRRCVWRVDVERRAGEGKSRGGKYGKPRPLCVGVGPT